MTSQPSRSRASTRMSRPGITAPTSARGFEIFFLFFGEVVVLLITSIVWPAVEGDEKTHDRFQPWVFAEISSYLRQGPAASSATTTTSRFTVTKVPITELEIRGIERDRSR